MLPCCALETMSWETSPVSAKVSTRFWLLTACCTPLGWGCIYACWLEIMTGMLVVPNLCSTVFTGEVLLGAKVTGMPRALGLLSTMVTIELLSGCSRVVPLLSTAAKMVVPF